MIHWQRQCFTYHPVIGRWYIPNLRARIPHERGSYWVRTNSLGMRADREYSQQKPPGRCRLVLLGDSFAAADGVNNEERFSDLLEQTHPGLEVLNFSLPNSGTDQQLLVYQTFAKAFETDAYLFAPLIENIGRNKGRYRPATDRVSGAVYYVSKPYYTLDAGGLTLHHQPVPRQCILAQDAPANVTKYVDFTGPHYRLRQFINRRLPFLKQPLQRWLKHHPYPDYLSSDRPGWRLMRAILEQLVSDVARKRPVFIVPLPTYHYIETDLPPIYLERFREVEAEAGGVYVLDILPYFHRLSAPERRACRFQHDVHYTPQAHRVVTTAISREIARRLPDFWDIH